MKRTRESRARFAFVEAVVAQAHGGSYSCAPRDNCFVPSAYKGDHHMFWKEGVEEILNLQPKGSKAKSYQVKQVRTVLLKYKLGGKPDAEI